MSDIPEIKKQLARGFARFVIKQGFGATCPTRTEDGKPMTWQARGRQMYGDQLFNVVMREEIAATKESTHAQERLSAVRGDQREVRRGGEAACRSEDTSSEDLEQQGVSRALLASGTSPT